ncbi:MAG: PAS domain S-box protein [Gammaproteobacteria bacterium]|nr:PAS domain S-box protein [Gammaproteobacteria bacterium]
MKRQRTEHALRDSEQRFRDFAESASDWFWETDADLRFTNITGRFEELTGESAASLIGRTRREVIETSKQTLSDEQVLMTDANIRDMEAHRPCRDFEITWHRSDGTLGTFLNTGKPVFDEDGNFKGYRGTGRDITERKRAEETLKESEDRFRALIENTLDIITLLGPDGTILFESPSIERVLGYKPEELVGRKVFDILHPDDVPQALDALQNSIQTPGRVNEIELRIRHRDGSWRHLQAIGRNLSDNPSVGGIVLNSRDVTERKQAEEALRESERNFRAIAEGSPVSLLITRRADGTILYANPKIGPVLGLPTEAFEGRNIAEFFWQPGERDGRATRLKDDGFIENEPLEMRRADGTRISTIHSLQCINYGGEEAILGSFQDVTERLRLADQLRQSQKMEAVGQLTGGVAHDFNNLLMVIMGNLELLLERTERDSKISNFAANALEAARRGADLTHRLLAFSRMQPLQPVSIDVNQLVNGMRDLLVRTLGEEIEIELVGGAGLWQCEVDPGQLENAILNLSINARDAMPHGGRLTIETANAHLDNAYAAGLNDVQPGQYVLLAISDTGRGMPPEVIAQAFDPFFTTQDVGEGSGLGLSMIYGFVKQSGGHARIYSEVGEGTTLKIYLPRSIADAGASPETGAHPVADTAASGEVIMVVEDDVDVRAVAVRILDELGYEVLEAGTAGAALAQVERTRRINLLITDVILPGGKGGRDLADKACELLPSLKVLYMSGYAQKAIMHHGRLDVGVQLFVKPFGRTDLAVKVREILVSAP